MNLLDKTQVSDLVVTLLAAAILALFGALWKAVLRNPYNSYVSIRKKTLQIMRDFRDPREIGNDTPLRDRIIFAQLDEIKIVVDSIDEESDNRMLSKFYNYAEIRILLVSLYEYIRDPIQLPQHKEFEDSYVLDTNKFFKKIKKELRVPKYKIIILALFFIISLGILLFYAMR